jgi:DNA repair exonuclease SbcCD ATPase subunit
MAKKSLTDLLHEEVKKSSKQESKTVQENTDDELQEQNAQLGEESPMNTQNNPSARRATPTKADLESTITELKTALKEAQHQEEKFVDLKNALEEAYKKEGALEQQITDLQSDLQHQKRLVHKLEKELEKLEPLKKEFEQAKKAALQLAEANDKLTQEINSLKKGNEPIKEQKSTALKEQKVSVIKEQEHAPRYQQPLRPVQKEADKPADFATKSWLL